MSIAAVIVSAVEWWLILGCVVAVAFLLFGIDRIDEDARGAYAFRPMLIPGILLIWPLVLWRWLRLERDAGPWMRRYQPPRAVHLPVAIAMACLVVAVILAGLSVKQTWPADIAPQNLSEPDA
ncbi:MAG: hypothetical protein AAGF79_14745 [Pseudomonadota bacterium]